MTKTDLSLSAPELSDTTGPAFALEGVTKRFGKKVALDQLSLSVPRGSVVGLIGRNGSGKTTLLNLLTNLLLPSAGHCRTLGQASPDLPESVLSRIGLVAQELQFLDWMNVGDQLDYVASYYPNWDRDRQKRLLEVLELDASAPIGPLSPGDKQKLAILVAVCHHPELLLLDEPVSALDPLARARFLEFLIELLNEDQPTVVISSHVLHDIERLVDWIVCLEKGRLCVSLPFDDLRESYAEWRVTLPAGDLAPDPFDEPFILESRGSGRSRKLLVENASENDLLSFRQRHQAEVSAHGVSLEALFPHLIRKGTAR